MRAIVRPVAMFALGCLLLLGVWDLVRPSPAFACSCAELPNVEEQLKYKTAIFTGKVKSITLPTEGPLYSSADPVKVVFDVDTVWKGDLGEETVVYTAQSSASCGYEGFVENQSYIVFAYDSDSQLETGLCEGTGPVSAVGDPDLEALGKGYPPNPDIAPIENTAETPEPSTDIKSVEDTKEKANTSAANNMPLTSMLIWLGVILGVTLIVIGIIKIVRARRS
ncbi:hypothetical protein FHS18_003267 [Paenibacillus phyllosphaerae]|uniref:Tissue inhibitor of metalloproteinase n=1 Tax=Paenibacillus phyllosphaerae TaxID=274593 RepID=A0A7W5AYP1_9BACL|nr:hypothetical protein [Paenibacillus phyllosphaerae]MBB3111199.1 hypothetical protein [Paenibacillus phyllosphaerae]